MRLVRVAALDRREDVAGGNRRRHAGALAERRVQDRQATLQARRAAEALVTLGKNAERDAKDVGAGLDGDKDGAEVTAEMPGDCVLEHVVKQELDVEPEAAVGDVGVDGVHIAGAVRARLQIRPCFLTERGQQQPDRRRGPVRGRRRRRRTDGMIADAKPTTALRPDHRHRTIRARRRRLARDDLGCMDYGETSAASLSPHSKPRHRVATPLSHH